MDQIYHIRKAKGKRVPVLLSIPHVGTDFPDELKEHYVAELAQKPDDTDFYLDRLYDFAPSLGITTIYAKYSRWVIDLNRNPEGKALYGDGRIITALCPLTDFRNRPIYKDPSLEPDAAELERRKKVYYYPYYAKVAELLEELRGENGQVLFWDAHSIRQYVPSIQADKFPDLILGNNDQQSADKRLIRLALDRLRSKGDEVTHNHPFKGGNLTRTIGNPQNGIHALQLEMVKKLYMDEKEVLYHEENAATIKSLLEQTFVSLIQRLNKMGTGTVF